MRVTKQSVYCGHSRPRHCSARRRQLLPERRGRRAGRRSRRDRRSRSPRPTRRCARSHRRSSAGRPACGFLQPRRSGAGTGSSSGPSCRPRGSRVPSARAERREVLVEDLILRCACRWRSARGVPDSTAGTRYASVLPVPVPASAISVPPSVERPRRPRRPAAAGRAAPRSRRTLPRAGRPSQRGVDAIGERPVAAMSRRGELRIEREAAGTALRRPP